jgi:hypothetical protein
VLAVSAALALLGVGLTVFLTIGAFRSRMRESLDGLGVDMAIASPDLVGESLERTRMLATLFDWVAFWWISLVLFGYATWLAYVSMTITTPGFGHLRYDFLAGLVMSMVAFALMISAENRLVRFKLRMLTGSKINDRKT